MMGRIFSLLALYRVIVVGRMKLQKGETTVWGIMELGPDINPESWASREKRRRTRAWMTWRRCQRGPLGTFEFTMPSWPRLVLISALWTMGWHLQPEGWSVLLSDVSNIQTPDFKSCHYTHLSHLLPHTSY